MALMLKQIRIFFFTAPCLVYNQRYTLLCTVNDIDSSLTNTTIIYFLDKFNIDSILDIFANTLVLNATMVFLVFCKI